MITIEGLKKAYKNKVIFKEAEVAFATNQIHYVMGANGAGKTSLFKCMLQLEEYGGTILFNGDKLDEARGKISVVFDDTPFYPNQSGLANLLMLYKGVFEKTAALYLAKELGMESLLKEKVKNYSYGERKKLAMLLALLGEPDFLLLDEVSNGLDYDTMALLQDRLPKWSENTTILMTGHHYEFYEAVVDHSYVIKNGGIHPVLDFNAEVKELGANVERPS